MGDLSDSEKSTLEAKWDHRHHKTFSRNNTLHNPAFRDYFGRSRDDAESWPGVKPVRKWRPTWQLTVGHQNKDADTTKLGFRNAAAPRGLPKRPAWDDRHHVTVSVANHLYHDGFREYF